MRSTFGRDRSTVAIWSAFRQTACRLLLRAKPARPGIAVLMSITASYLCAPAQAAQVVATITGTIQQGTDRTGVFGFAPGTSLGGQNFQLVYVINDSEGQQGIYYSNGVPYGSYIQNSGLNNPITATLTINNRSFTFGTRPISEVTSYVERYVTSATAGADAIYFYLQENLSPPTGGDAISNNIVSANVDFTSNYNWDSPISFSGPFTEAITSFGIDYTTQSAYGYLIANSITIEGPQPPSAVSQPFIIDPVASGLLNGPNIVTDPNALAGAAVTVQGVAADGATEVVIAIPASTVDEQFQLSISPSGASDTFGSLEPLGSTTGSSSNSVTVQAVSTSRGPMAFAIYLAPANYVSIAQDASTTTRYIELQISSQQTPSYSSTLNVLVTRPPVALIHGLWGSPDDWNIFQLDPTVFTSQNQQRLSYNSYLSNIKATDPSYPVSDLSKIQLNSMGIAYIVPSVLTQLRAFIKNFRQSYNVAAVQADIIGHSMGGLIARTMVLQSDFASADTFGRGLIHKLITIGTPHLGTPIAQDFLEDDNSCVRSIFANFGDNEIALRTLTFDDGTTVSGAINDLQVGSDALESLRPEGAEPFPTAHIAGIATAQNLGSLSCSFPCTPSILRLCPGNLADNFTPTGWPTLFSSESNDAIVPINSQLNGPSASTLTMSNVVHSQGIIDLGFTGPPELQSSGTQISTMVTNLLNEAVDGPDYQ
jgi:pimeloyl-ACP methyl ester carboxylesterase